MTNIGLNVGLKALLTAQSALDNVGHNISNANTPGYSRQSLDVSASRPLLLRGLIIGNGVQSDGIRRTVDELLNRRLVSGIASLQKLDTKLAGMSSIEALFGEPDGSGIGGRIEDVFASFSALSASPEDRVLRTGVTQSLSALAANFHAAADTLTQAADDSTQRVKASVAEVNSLTDQIVGLNREIGKLEASGGSANDLRDQRDEALRALAGEIDVTYHEDESGSVRVFADGQLLVGSKDKNNLQARVSSDGKVEVWIDGSTAPIQPHGGRIAGLLDLGTGFVPDLRMQMDRLARSLILEMNRAHSTGVPASGGFDQLIGSYAVQDVDGDGLRTDELLSQAGLEFPVHDGELFVNVRSKATGEITTTVVTIDANRTSVGDLLDTLNGISGLNASLDSSGRMQLFADGSLTFDFGRPLDTAPDDIGSFGGSQASLGTAGGEPFALADGDTLGLQGTLGAFTVTFDAADFVDVGQATATEVAAAINADPNTSANGLLASVAGGRLVIQTATGGPSASFDVLNGTSLGALGWVGGTTVTGQDTAVEVSLSGVYDGTTNQRLSFTPNMDGTIGTTSGLTIDVRNESGGLVTTLEVGEGYVPGTELGLAGGVSVSFSAGGVSATDHDTFATNLIADSDTSDVLVSLGLNSLLIGTDAATIDVRPELESDPMLLATSAGGAAGDNRAVLDLIALQHEDAEGLEASLGGFWGNVVGEVGFDIRSTSSAFEVETSLVGDLESRREQVSGVNVDEELVNMIKYEQAFGAAAQYIQVVNSLSEELLALI